MKILNNKFDFIDQESSIYTKSQLKIWAQILAFYFCFVRFFLIMSMCYLLLLQSCKAVKSELACLFNTSDGNYDNNVHFF